MKARVRSIFASAGFEAILLLVCTIVPFFWIDTSFARGIPSLSWLGPYRQYELQTGQSVGHFQYFVLIYVIYNCVVFKDVFANYKVGLWALIKKHRYFMMPFRQNRRRLAIASMFVCAFALLLSQFAEPYEGTRAGSVGYILLMGHVGLLLIPSFVKYSIIPYLIELSEFEEPWGD